ncbi:hypothetical protein GGI22_004723, partial [Coemansia erecta]
TANSELVEGSSMPSSCALNVHSLANRLDSTQLASVKDALKFINRPRVLEAESSDSENSSDSQSIAAQNRHLAKSAIIPESKPISDAPQALESRFHVIRRVILGNSSQYVAPQNRPPGEENSTHRWTVCIRSASTEHPADNYIRKVRVFLHPSYRPDDIVDLVPPEFSLTRWGWGEFPVRLQVFFRDKRNKPVDLIHMLKLDDMWTGNAVLGAEKTIDFELDRRGLEALPPLTEDHNSTVTCNPPPYNAILYKVLKHLCSVYPLVLADALPHGRELPESPEQILDMVPASIVEKWTWGVAVSEDIWRNVWPVGKRLAAEDSRNRALLALISRALPKLSETSLINRWDKSDDEYDVDIMLTIDGDKTISEIKNTASSIRTHHLEQQGERDLGDHFSEEMAGGVHSLDENDYGSADRAIDWVWASIRPLELTCAPASRFTESSNIPGAYGIAKPGNLVQLPNCNDEAFGEALEQRLVVGELFVDIAKLFLRDIISASDMAMRTN